jgi:3-phosphoshikimate 1-carboxyvinyltransferase
MRVEPAAALVGDVAVPGTKSIAHRAVLFGAIAEGETEIRNFGRSDDTQSTVDAVRALGVSVDGRDDVVRVHGVGLRGLNAPEAPIDCGNAGTLLRLITGILAGQNGTFTLTGDESLSVRPMERIAAPLRQMGADVETTDGHAPVTIRGGPRLRPIVYQLPVASAQVKSCVLLAGLYADGGPTTVVEHGAQTRDHTEVLLRQMGARVQASPRQASVWPVGRLKPLSVEVPGDFSSAAPLIVAATLLAGSELRIHGVNLNPTRTGLVDVLGRMGARIAVFNRRTLAGEPAGDLEVRSAPLTATSIGPEEVPALIDELPLFALAAGMARGSSSVEGAQELRAKESNRIEAVTTSLKTLGIRASARDDGFGVRGVASRPKGGGMDSLGDHRLAMLGAVAGLVSREGVDVGGADAVSISFPGFFDLLDSVTRR